jgi:hypothetical protein
LLLFAIAAKSTQKGLENPNGLPACKAPSVDFLPPRASKKICFKEAPKL